MKHLLSFSILLLLLVGCRSDPISVLRWSKTEIGVGARSIGEVKQILWLAQEEARLSDLTPVWTEEVPPDLLDQIAVEEEWSHSLFLSTFWVEDRDLGDQLLKARLSFSISDSRSEIEGFNVVSEGDARIEAIFSGLYSPSLNEDKVEEMATRIVRSVVDYLNNLLNRVAEDKGAWATVLSRDETK